MALLNVLWTSTALKRRNSIFEYWNDRNKSREYYQKLNLKVKERIGLLKTIPKLGIKTEFKETRVLSLGQFSIFYKKKIFNDLFHSILGQQARSQEINKIFKAMNEFLLILAFK